MLMVQERKPAYRSLERWAVRTLLHAGAIKECADHGYIQCRAEAEAFAVARAAGGDLT